jgi:hypothetical protein
MLGPLVLVLRYPVFVVTWWITGTMAIACYTAAFVWTMEVAAGKWKIYLGMSMNYSWPVCRLIIAGKSDLKSLVYETFIDRLGLEPKGLALASSVYLSSCCGRGGHSLLVARVSAMAGCKVLYFYSLISYYQTTFPGVAWMKQNKSSQMQARKMVNQ